MMTLFPLYSYKYIVYYQFRKRYLSMNGILIEDIVKDDWNA